VSTGSLAIERWEQDREVRDRQALRRLWVSSLFGHALFLLVLLGLPSSAPPPLPEVVSVDLVAAAPRAAAPVASPRVTAKPPAPRPPAPKPVALPPPKEREAPKKVLPRKAPEPRAKPRPRRERRPSPKPPALDYDSALSSLRDELGEPAPETEAVLDVAPDATPAGGTVDPVLAAWQLAVNRAIARSWVTPTNYRRSSLRTLLLVTVMANGQVLGEPEVRRSSGDPQFDDNAIRAVLGASPLPPPPSSGDWPFLFNPNE